MYMLLSKVHDPYFQMIYSANPRLRDSGVNAIESLMERRGAFDYILLETTGLADPGNIAPLFWVDEGLGSTIYLDGIVTLVDAKNLLKILDETPPSLAQYAEDGHLGAEMTTAHLQISHADVIIINKVDLVTPEELNTVKDRIRSINSLAKLHFALHSQVPQLDHVLLDLNAYSSVKAEDLEFASKGHSHLDPSISTITLPVPVLNSSQLSELDAWLRSVLWDSALPGQGNAEAEDFEVHRTKGRIQLIDGSTKLIQGVREIFELLAERVASGGSGSPPDHQPTGGKLVLIGRGLNEEAFGRSLKTSLDFSAR
jgi:G3E family GTPase